MVAGADIYEVCKNGDDYIEAEFAKVYNKKVNGRVVNKGVAFPTSVSPNHFAGHIAPFDEKDSWKLEAGDVVKIDMGGHIDGYAVMVAHTVLIPGGEDDERKHKTIMAAWTAQQAAMRCVQVGKSSLDVSKYMNLAAEEYGCNMIQGVLSHQMKQHIVAGNNCILSKESPNEKVEEYIFQENDVFCIDVLVSSGEGKTRETEQKCTIYKRDPEVNYTLRTPKARQFISEVARRYPSMPFCLRAIEDPLVANIGKTEALRHGLIDPYPVLREKEGEFVAHFKYTVLMLPSGSKKVTGINKLGQDFPTVEIQNEELKELLAISLNPKKAKKQAKAKA